jgi:glycosyltransferase involved in cell wall biosynthesis
VSITRIAVVIPARDEEALVARSLDSVLAARRFVEARMPGVAVAVVVVADSCVDATADIARRYDDVTVVEVAAANVGVARAAGVDAALALVGGPDSVWIANTDADSRVPRRWLYEHARLARRGVDVVIGTVRPEFDDLSPEQARAWHATHTAGTANGHVHGANLGVRASVYLAAGGFPRLAEHEDVELVERCLLAGAASAATAQCEVVTSGRQVGRTPGGYARHLRTELTASVAPPIPG